MRVAERNLFAFSFEYGSCLSVNQQQVIRFKTAAHGGFTDRDGGHAGGVLVTVDDFPTRIFQLAVNPFPRSLFGFQIGHDLFPSYSLDFHIPNSDMHSFD